MTTQRVSLAGKNIPITGGLGFIGSNLAIRLVRTVDFDRETRGLFLIAARPGPAGLHPPPHLG